MSGMRAPIYDPCDMELGRRRGLRVFIGEFADFVIPKIN